MNIITKRVLFLTLLLLAAISLLGLTTQNDIQNVDQKYWTKWTEVTIQNIPPGEKLLQDDFNRSDGDGLGLPWVEGNEATSEYTNPQGRKVGPGYIELYNSALAFHYNNHSQKVNSNSFNHLPYVIAPLNKPVNTYPVTLYFTFTPHADERINHVVGLMSADDGLTQITDSTIGRVHFVPKNGLGIQLLRTSYTFDNTKAKLVKYENDVETTLTEENLTFQFETGMEYTVQVTIGQNFTINTIISSPTEINGFTHTQNSDPFVLDQFFLVDTQGGISGGTIGSGDYRLFFDNLLVQQTYEVGLPIIIR